MTKTTGGQRATGFDEVKKALNQFGALGAAVDAIADATGCNYHTSRRYLEILVDEGRASRMPFRRNGKIIYRMDYIGTMPALPVLGDGPPVPLHKMIRANIKNPNELISVKMLKRFPLYLAQMARLAAMSRSGDDTEAPDTAHWAAIRDDLIALQARATMIANHCQVLLDYNGLFDNEHSFELWFGDATNYYTPEEALADYQKLNELLEGH